MRLALTILLIVMGVSALALSGWINASAGLAAGTTADAGLQLAALFVLIDLSKAGLLTAATVLLAERARWFAVGLAAAGVVLAVLSFANVSGRIAHLRASEASVVTTQAALAIDAREEFVSSQIQAHRARLGHPRSSPARPDRDPENRSALAIDRRMQRRHTRREPSLLRRVPSAKPSWRGAAKRNGWSVLSRT